MRLSLYSFITRDRDIVIITLYQGDADMNIDV